MLQLPKSVDSIEGAASSGILPLMNEVKWKVSKNGIKELHPSKYGWKGVCLSDLERKLNYSGCTATELDKIFRTSPDLYKSFLGGVLRLASLYGTALGQNSLCLQNLSPAWVYILQRVTYLFGNLRTRAWKKGAINMLGQRWMVELTEPWL